MIEQLWSLGNVSREQLPDSAQGRAHSRRLDRLRCIRRACTALIHDSKLDKPTEEDIHYQQLLKKGFEQFSDRFVEQQKILERGTLVLQFRSALLKMNAVRHLRIDDDVDKRPTHSRRRIQDSSDVSLMDDEELLESLSRPQSILRSDQQYNASGIDATSLIPALLVDLHTIDFRHLVSLEIEMSKSRSFKGLSAADTVYSKIGAAVQNLKAFRFIHREPVVSHSIDEVITLRDFLNSVINVASLESLVIRTNLWNQEKDVFDPDQSPFVSLIKARTDWSNLSSVLLDTLHIEHSDLTHLLSCVNSGSGYVGLHRIHLMDGSWATVLDLLKERHGWSNLDSPSGAECEDMSPVQYDRIFGGYDMPRLHDHMQNEEASGLEEALSYIRGWQDHNPLNVPPVINQN